MLNRSVFRNLSMLWLFGIVRSISENVFDTLDRLGMIVFQTVLFRGLVHRNGIGWIKSINRLVVVDLKSDSNARFNESEFLVCKYI